MNVKIEKIIEQITLNKQVDVANVFRCIKITDEIAQAVASAMKNNTLVTELDFSYSVISEFGLAVLCEALKANNTLKSLILDCIKPAFHSYAYVTGLSDANYMNLAELFKVNNSIVHLSIRNQYSLNNKCTPKGINALFSSLKDNYTLKSLNLTLNGIDDESFIYFTNCLKSNISLTDFNFDNNKITPVGVNYFYHLLKTKTNIASIALSSNPIGDEGLQILAKVLATNTSIVSIELWQSGITDLGVKALADAIQSNQSLNTLKLGNNVITNDGAIALFESLKHNKNLKTLELRYCKLDSKSCDSLADFLKRTPSLKTVDLKNNNIDARGALKLYESIRKNTSLETLNLGNNPIQSDQFHQATALESLEVNYTLIDLGYDHWARWTIMKRNNAFNKLIRTFHIDSTLDEIALEEGMTKLDQLFPNLDPEAQSHPSQVYRLLAAMWHCRQNTLKSLVHASESLQQPFTFIELQNTANTLILGIASQVFNLLKTLNKKPEAANHPNAFFRSFTQNEEGEAVHANSINL